MDLLNRVLNLKKEEHPAVPDMEKMFPMEIFTKNCGGIGSGVKW
jgi:hypothetical protein